MSVAATVAPQIELWGGIECTVNRIGDTYSSQIERSGHDRRGDDIDRCAALGIRTMRYPVLWELIAPHGLDQADWATSDGPLARLCELGVGVIAGLVHHGSGPRDTSLVDPQFGDKLARFAGLVAERYPWIERYTPVNEPLTTARFSGLYGVWYPHGRDPATFKNALLGQCRAVVLAMRAIRQVNPAAQLVQTEDLGRTYSTPELDYQARLNNQVRWLTWDLLCGAISREHPLWDWLTAECGASAAELMWFADNPCRPDLLGANYYVTSERFLDQRVERYPQRYHGGNGKHDYADIETARCLGNPTGGLCPLLHEAWDRYALPMAVTEVHIDATREDQLRWHAEIWQAAAWARRSGVDLRAVTAWGLLGLYDWNSLLQNNAGYYEPGAFDVRGPLPRATAVAALLRELACGERTSHPVLSQPGWWRRDRRLYCVPAHAAQAIDAPLPWIRRGIEQPILIAGANGTLGRCFARLCAERGLAYRAIPRAALDVASRASVEAAIATHRPWAIVNAAGYARIEAAERDAGRCFRENTVGVSVLASACARHRVALAVFSSAQVFDGRRASPYVETDLPAPLNVYGKSKAQAEAQVNLLHADALLIRTSCLFDAWDDRNYLTAALRTLRAGLPLDAASELTVSPTYAPDLVHACLDLLVDRENGIWHLSNGQPITLANFLARVALRARVSCASLRPRTRAELRRAAPRPAYSALASHRSDLMPKLGDAIDRYVRERELNDAA